MPKDGDFKRLVRNRMAETGVRYAAARAALTAERAPGDPILTDRTRSLLGQLAHVDRARGAAESLSRLPEGERRAAAIDGLAHESWRVRRTCAQLLDRVDLTPASVAAITRALRDEQRLRERWESDDRRRELTAALLARTERHQGRWIAIRDGRIVAVANGQARIFRRELQAGATSYWVAPPHASRPRLD